MRSLWRWVRGRGKRGLGRPYEPSTRLPRETMEVSGTWLMRASANYHEATLGWMMGVGLYRQIRLDRQDHLLRLISVDRGTVANRAKSHRAEPVYRVAMRIWVGVEPILTEWAMFDVLSSDFDAIVPSGQGGWVMGGKKSGTMGLIYARDFGAVGDGRTDDTAAIQAAVNASADAHGRKVWNNA